MSHSLFDKNAKLALIVACTMLLTCGVVFQIAIAALNVYLKKQPVELRGGFATIERTLGPWKAVGDDRTLRREMIEELGTDRYLDRTYVLDGDRNAPPMNVHLAYYTGMIDTVPHVPDRCMGAAGFNIKRLPENLPLDIDRRGWESDPKLINLATQTPYEFISIKSDFAYVPMNNDSVSRKIVCMPVGEMRLRTTEFEQPNHPEQRIFGGYFFIANGRLTPSPEGVRVMAFNLSEKYAYYCKVQFTCGGAGLTQEKYLSMVSSLLQELLPELMQRLPDWPEIERRDNPDHPTLNQPSTSS